MGIPFLLYGSNGYTGRLIAHRAMERDVPLILAGRNREEVQAQASELKLPHRIVSLDNPKALDAALADVPVVLHSAGPFSRTSRPMAGACLRTGTHYLDITGEIEVFEALAARDAEARAAGVMLLPGVGFDVVPSDCLAAHLKQRLPSATRLALAFHGVGGMSRGTATTMVENIDRGGVIRRDGRLKPVPTAWKTRQVDFGRGPVTVTTIRWGDIATAYRSTGIPNIEVYTRVPAAARRMMRVTRHLGWLLGSPPAQAVLRRVVRSGAPGPDAQARAKGLTLLWGEVEDEQGQRSVSRMRGPEGYTFTALAAVAAVEKVLAGHAPAGFQTPSLAYGADFVLEIEGVSREDVV
jgi:short subunit dehydrogenase-like uncharacterized protein